MKKKMDKVTKGDGYKPSGKTIMPIKDMAEARAGKMTSYLKKGSKKS